MVSIKDERTENSTSGQVQYVNKLNGIKVGGEMLAS